MTDQTPHDTTGPERPEARPAAEPDLGGRFFHLGALLRRGQHHGHGPRGGGKHFGQGRVLRLLALHSPIAQRELSYLLGLRPQSLSELLEKLETAGRIRRAPSPRDRRAYTVEITEEGRAALAAEAEAEDPFSVLDDQERTQLAALLDRVIERVESRLPEPGHEHPRDDEHPHGPGHPYGGPRGYGRGRGRGAGRFGPEDEDGRGAERAEFERFRGWPGRRSPRWA